MSESTERFKCPARHPAAGPTATFGNLIYWNEVDKGDHFAAWEQPELFSQEPRAALGSLRQRD